MAVIPLAVRKAEYSLLELALPGRPVENYGVLLFDPEAGELHARLRDEPAESADPEDAEVLSRLGTDLAAKARELGGAPLLDLLEDSLSNVLRITERRSAAVRNFPVALERLYREHVLGVARAPAEVMPFRTHVPLYSLRAAAGRFGQDMEVEPEGWAALPAGVRPSPDMYAVHVTGRSMEPEVPDGSLALFRLNPAGSRQGKRVLVWRRGISDTGGEFTLKVYESRKRVSEQGWEHAGITLRPLNPEFEPVELEDGGEYRVLGEYICTLALDDLN
jgi:SOS-response transcriptional repressor LexA